MTPRAAGLATIASTLLLALPATAAAGTWKYNGNFGSTGAGVEFKVHREDGKAKYLKLFDFHNIPAQCLGQGATAVTGELDKHIAVDDEKFHATGKATDSNETLTVHGKLKHGEKKAKGTLRVTGTAPGCPDVDTGVVDWHAHHVQ